MRPAEIMVVEDNPITRKLVRLTLEGEGYLVLEAGDGRIAADLATGHPLALILQDLYLPDIDGLELCARLRSVSIAKDVPIIAFSGLRSRLEEARSLNAGFTDYLFKPVEPSRLLEVVRAHLPVPSESPPEIGGGRRVLLVDDDSVQRGLDRARLETVGFEVTPAQDGVSALRLAQDRPPDAIVAQVLMPGMSGLDLCLAARSDDRMTQVPVVLTSATFQHMEEADLAIARDLGASAIVPRTPGLEEVIGALVAGLDAGPPPRPSPEVRANSSKYFDRFLRQVKLQATVNTRLAQRAALDSALLSITWCAGAVLRSRLSLQDMLNQVLACALDVGGVSAGAIYLDEPDGAIRLRAEIGQFASSADSPDFFSHPDLLRSLIAKGRPVHLAEGTPPAGESADLLARAGDRSMVVAPMIAGGEAFGALVMMVGQRQLERHWLAGIGAVATQLAQAVALSRTVEATTERARLAELSAEVSRALAGSTAMGDMLKACVEPLVRHLGAAVVGIWTSDHETGTLELRASAGPSALPDGAYARVAEGQGAIGLVARERRTIALDLLPGHPVVHDPSWVRREGLVAFAGYPLITENRVRGVMALFASARLPPVILEGLKQVADGIAVGIERCLGQEALRRSEEQYRVLFEANPHPMWVFHGPTLAVIAVNDTAIRHYGYSREEFLRMSVEDFRPAEAVPVLREAVERVSRTGYELTALKLRRRDGTILDVECTWHTMSFAGEAVVLVLARDVTDRVRAEAELRAIQGRLEYVIASSPAVIYTMHGAAGDYAPTWISENVERVIGYSVAEALTPDWWTERVHPDDFQRVMSELPLLQRRGRVLHEYRFQHKDGGYRWILDEQRTLGEPNGEKHEIIGSWVDITERRLLEEQFRQAQKMEAVGQLAGGVAHDFNNLLTAIMGYSELALQDLRPDDPLREDLAEIRKAAERAGSLTRQLLAFSRQQILAPRVLDLNAVVADIDSMIRRVVSENVDITTVLAPGLGHVRADPSQVHQVLMNLIVNARDAMPEGGNLTIETANADVDESHGHGMTTFPAGSYVVLAVSDTGIGMDERTQARIFEPFFTTKEQGKGTGLGLSMVYGIVKQSDGFIWVYSEPGRGATIRVYLPRVAEAAEDLPVAQAAAPVVGGSETVLVVEDDDGVRGLTRTTLIRRGYRVLEATNGAEALRVSDAFQGTIALLISDVVMPGIGGPDLVHRLAPLRPDMRVLFVSGYTDLAVAHQGQIEPGTAFLAKPYTSEALARKIREVLDAGRPEPPGGARR